MFGPEDRRWGEVYDLRPRRTKIGGVLLSSDPKTRKLNMRDPSILGSEERKREGFFEKGGVLRKFVPDYSQTNRTHLP